MRLFRYCVYTLIIGRLIQMISALYFIRTNHALLQQYASIALPFDFKAFNTIFLIMGISIFVSFLLMYFFKRHNETIILAVLSIFFIMALSKGIHAFPFVYQILDLSCQVSVMLLLFLKRKPKKSLLLYVLLGSTFLHHGLLAIGFPQTPDLFFVMVHNILQLDFEGSKSFLWIVGIIDIIVFFCVLFPITRKPALVYMAIWGLLTAFARIIAFRHQPVDEWILLWLPQTLFRICNGLLPLVMLREVKIE